MKDNIIEIKSKPANLCVKPIGNGYAVFCGVIMISEIRANHGQAWKSLSDISSAKQTEWLIHQKRNAKEVTPKY